jgi:hypothetical protein
MTAIGFRPILPILSIVGWLFGGGPNDLRSSEDWIDVSFTVVFSGLRRLSEFCVIRMTRRSEAVAARDERRSHRETALVPLVSPLHDLARTCR